MIRSLSRKTGNKKPLGRDEGSPRGTTLLRRSPGALLGRSMPAAPRNGGSPGTTTGARRAFTVRLGRELHRRATGAALSRWLAFPGRRDDGYSAPSSPL